MNAIENTCKSCGTTYVVEDAFAEIFGEVAPPSNDKMCPDCEAKWLEAHKNEIYEGP